MSKMNLRNFSFHSDSVHTEQFLVYNQSETFDIQWINSSETGRFLLASLFMTLGLLSLPGNFAIAAAVFRNGLRDRPVNLLILVDQCVSSVQMYQTSFLHQYLLICKGCSLGEYFCSYLQWCKTLGILNTTLGSLPIAVFRLIMLSSTQAVSLKKQHVISRCLLMTCLIANSYMTWTIANAPITEVSPYKSMCLQRSRQFTKVLQSYIRSNTSAWPVALTVLGVTAFLQHLKGFVYLVIFWIIYRHEKTVVPFLTERSIKSRRKRNALSMISQVYIYVMEQACLSGLFLISATNKTHKIGYWGPILVQLLFASRCTVQALASAEPRQECITLLKKIKGVFVLRSHQD